MSVRFTLAFAALFSFALSGCGSNNPPTFPVTGKVTFNGEALPMGSLLLQPKAGGPSAQGVINSDGTYSVWTFEEGDGAIPGTHTVLISAAKDNGPESPVTPLIPDKYGTFNSGLEVEVKEGDNTANFELTGKAPKPNRQTVMP
jgi:hypothetical protein